MSMIKILVIISCSKNSTLLRKRVYWPAYGFFISILFLKKQLIVIHAKNYIIQKNKKITYFLNIQEVEQVLDTPDTKTIFRLRDRAMLELLYSCGLRVSELINLSYHNINLNEEYIRIHGKGNKERVLLMGEVVMNYLGVYEEKSRPSPDELLNQPRNQRSILLSLSKRCGYNNK